MDRMIDYFFYDIAWAKESKLRAEEKKKEKEQKKREEE